MGYRFTSQDVGCWADGAYGEDHRRRKLAAMLRDLGAEGAALYLDEEPSDDYSEEDDALDILQKHTAPGLLWFMESGDLLLDWAEAR